MFARFKPAPPHSESLILSQFTRKQPSRPSRYVAGVMIDASETLICPSCSEEQRKPEHGGHTGCEACGLRFVVFGNSLNIWRDEPRLKVV